MGEEGWKDFYASVIPFCLQWGAVETWTAYLKSDLQLISCSSSVSTPEKLMSLLRTKLKL